MSYMAGIRELHVKYFPLNMQFYPSYIGDNSNDFEDITVSDEEDLPF